MVTIDASLVLSPLDSGDQRVRRWTACGGQRGRCSARGRVLFIFFSHCLVHSQKLKKIVILEGVISIGRDAFCGKSTLEAV